MIRIPDPRSGCGVELTVQMHRLHLCKRLYGRLSLVQLVDGRLDRQVDDLVYVLVKAARRRAPDARRAG